MLVRVTRQGGSVLDEVFDKMGAEMTKKPRLDGMLDERNYTEGLANGTIQPSHKNQAQAVYPNIPAFRLIHCRHQNILTHWRKT